MYLFYCTTNLYVKRNNISDNMQCFYYVVLILAKQTIRIVKINNDFLSVVSCDSDIDFVYIFRFGSIHKQDSRPPPGPKREVPSYVSARAHNRQELCTRQDTEPIINWAELWILRQFSLCERKLACVFIVKIDLPKSFRFQFFCMFRNILLKCFVIFNMISSWNIVATFYIYSVAF